MKRIIQLFLVIMIIFTPNHALALSSKQGSDPTGKSQRYVIEQAPWLDPSACDPNNSPTPTNTSGVFKVVSGDKIYVIGDSITVGMRDFGGLASKMTEKGLVVAEPIDAIGGKPLKWGIDQISTRNDLGDVDVVLIGLGTNNSVTPDKEFSNQVDQMVQAVKQKAPNAKIVWTNFYGEGKAGPPALLVEVNFDVEYPRLNKVLEAKSKELGFSIIPWASSNEAKEYVGNNDVHPSGKYPEMANFIVNQLSNGTGGVSGNQSINDCLCSNNGGSFTPTGDNKRDIWNYLTKNKSLSPNQAAGIMGNIQAESGFRSDIIQGGATAPPDYNPQNSVGFGLAQWTFDARQVPLEDRARSENKPVTDLGLQLDYLWWELTEGPFKSIGDQLKQTTTLEEATYLILEKFEVPADIPGNKPIRLGFAETILRDLQGITGGGSGGGTDSCQPGGATAPNASVAKIIEIAQQELILAANESDDSYHKYTMGRSEAWCADFVSWVLREAGMPFTGGNDDWNIPSVDGVQAWFESKNSYHPARSGYIPQPGDIAIFNEGVSPYPSHVTIVIEVNGDKMVTIGGNEGDKVSKNSHNDINAGYITGYGTPVAQ